MKPRRGPLLAAWLLGFFLVANVFLLPSLEQSPRGTDALGVVIGLWLLWKFAFGGLRAKPLVLLLLLSAIPALWATYAFLYSAEEMQSAVLGARWMLAVPLGYALIVVARDPRRRVSLAWGLWWGCVMNVVVLILQRSGFTQLTLDIGLAARDSAVDATLWELGGVVRAVGMHYHANGSAAIVSLIVPLSLYLLFTRKAGIWVLIVGLGLLVVGTELTLTRSALLVSFMTMFVVFLSSKDLKPSLLLAAFFLLVGGPALYLLGPPGGWQRWLDNSNLDSNGGERIESSIEGLQMALTNPSGFGAAGALEAMNGAGYPASHNAFVQVAMMFGPLLGIVLAVLMFALAARTFAGPGAAYGLEAVLALHLVGLFFWEDHLYNPSFVYLTNWLAVTSMIWIASRFGRRSPARPASSGALDGTPGYAGALAPPTGTRHLGKRGPRKRTDEPVSGRRAKYWKELGNA